MPTEALERKPGQFAEERFRARKRRWLLRIWWVFPLLVVFETAVFAGFGLAFGHGLFKLFLGVGLGVSLGMVMCFSDTPPHHIERWRQGAEGERLTAKALKRLTADGWTLVHDIDQRWGNIDHLLVGPPGLFLLESKNLHGMLRVERGRLIVRWREDPEDGYENDAIGRRAKAASAALASALRRPDARRVWVQPVIVLWGNFEQRSVESDGVAWVDGAALADVLEGRPTRLNAHEIQALSARLRSANGTVDPVGAGGGEDRAPVAQVQ